MIATVKEQQPSSIDPDTKLEAEVDQVIAACDGNTRAAIRALVIFGHQQEKKLADMQTAVSHGFARGRFLPINS